MQKKSLFVVSLFTSITLFGNTSLEGKWFCHKITYKDGRELEINHPLFSTYLSYEFNSGQVFISNNYKEKGISSRYSISKTRIQIGFRKFDYSISNKFLILEELEDELKYHFLKKEDFLKANNLYQEDYFVNEKDTIFSRSFYLNPEFDYELSFSDYLRKSIHNYSEASTQRHQFKGSFVLARDNEIRNITVERGIGKSFDKSFRKAVQESQKYWRNKTGKNILIVQKFTFFEHGKLFVKQENRAFYHKVKKADSYYKKLDFHMAIEHYQQALAVEVAENEFTNIMLRDLSRNLGISYLAIGENKRACESFRMVGDEYDFTFKNFILKFCQ